MAKVTIPLAGGSPPLFLHQNSSLSTAISLRCREAPSSSSSSSFSASFSSSSPSIKWHLCKPHPPPRASFNGLLPISTSLAMLLWAHPALCATIKMGAEEGTLVFVPSSISVPAGEKVVFINNKGFPHNVIFEKAGVPEGVDADKISHEDYMNEQGEQFVVTLKEKGTYKFFCEPHRAAGMSGEITVT